MINDLDVSFFQTIANEELRRIHNEELHCLYLSTNIVREIKTRRLRGAGHLVKKEECRSVFKTLADKPAGKRPLEGLGVDWRTIL